MWPPGPPWWTSAYKKIANNGNDADYQAVANVGVNGVDLAVMKGASSSIDGEIGLVPKCGKGNQWKYLRGDGSWQYPDDTTYSVFNSSNDGLVPKTDKSNYFLCGNGKWGYPWISAWNDDTTGNMQLCIGSGDEKLNTVEIPEATKNHNGLLSTYDKNLIDYCLYPGMIMIKYFNVSLSLPSTNKMEITYFNQKFTNKVYENEPCYWLFDLAKNNRMKINYEPRFMGSSYGVITEFSNGADITYSSGSDSKGNYIETVFYLVGKWQNLSDATHSGIVRATVDFYTTNYNIQV